MSGVELLVKYLVLVACVHNRGVSAIQGGKIHAQPPLTFQLSENL